MNIFNHYDNFVFQNNIYHKIGFCTNHQMGKYLFTGQLGVLIEKAEVGFPTDIDYIMSNLTSESTFAMTRYVDYALSLVTNKAGINQIEFYLFNGSQIQRNYSSLFFNRRGDWEIVKKAFKLGLIDEIQAYAR